MWILLITIMAYGGNYVSTMTQIEFGSKKLCEEAQKQVKAQHPQFKAVCLEQGELR